MKNKQDELWPPFNSPNRIHYPDDRPDLDLDTYNQAKRHFTQQAFTEVEKALSPPEDYDLLSRMRKAVFDFHFYENQETSPKVGKQKLGEFIGLIEQLQNFIEKNPQTLVNVARKSQAENAKLLVSLLIHFKDDAEQLRDGLAVKKGRKMNIALRVYQTHLLLIYESCGKRATSRTGTDTYKDNKPYGPAYDFFRAAFKLIGQNYSDHSINKYLKDTIRKRDKIKPSKHLQR